MIRVPEAWRASAPPSRSTSSPSPLSTPTLAIIGEQDPYTPPEDVAALEADAGHRGALPEAEHGFVHDPDRPAHRPDDAADAWQRAIAFLSS